MNKIIVGLFLSGLLFGSGPCIASCGPILVSYIVGTKKSIFKGLVVYILFSLSRISVYLVLSVLIFFLGNFLLERFLRNFSKYILALGGAFIILVGVLLAGSRRLEFRPWQFLEKNIIRRDKKSMLALGLVTGLLPCAPLLAILSYVGLVSKSWLESLFYSFSFGLGTFISPLVLLVILAGLIPKFLVDKKGLYAQIFSFISGLVIIFLGLQLVRRAF
jgi:sulfite exporter TauE/SafE